MAAQLRIWHTGDVHSCFDRFSGIAGFLKANRDRERDLYLDAGDVADERSVIVSGTGGVGAVELMKSAGCDAMAVGNNEFFAGPEKLTLMAARGLPMLSVNLRRLDGEEIQGVLPYVILRRQGLRILVLGADPYWPTIRGQESFTDMSRILLLDPKECLSRLLPALRGQYDICLLLSHCGLEEDRRIAAAVPGINLILGGHSHSLTPSPERVGNTWIFHSGCYGEHLGCVELLWDGAVTEVSGRVLPNVFPPDRELSELMVSLEKQGRQALGVPLYSIGTALDYEPYAECPAVNALADALFSVAECDFALVNNGAVSCGIPKVISKMCLLEACPSILNPTLVYWKGSTVLEALRASLDPEFVRQSGRGAGFRGKTLGAMAVSKNVRIKAEPFSVTVDGEPLDPERIYAVMADDYLFRGTGYAMLRGSVKRERYFAGYLRDLLERKLRDEIIVSGAAKKRIDY